MLIPKSNENIVELLELRDECKGGRIIVRAVLDSCKNKKLGQKRSGKDLKSNFSTPMIKKEKYIPLADYNGEHLK